MYVIDITICFGVKAFSLFSMDIYILK